MRVPSGAGRRAPGSGRRAPGAHDEIALPVPWQSPDGRPRQGARRSSPCAGSARALAARASGGRRSSGVFAGTQSGGLRVAQYETAVCPGRRHISPYSGARNRVSAPSGRTSRAPHRPALHRALGPAPARARPGRRAGSCLPAGDHREGAGRAVPDQPDDGPRASPTPGRPQATPGTGRGRRRRQGCQAIWPIWRWSVDRRRSAGAACGADHCAAGPREGRRRTAAARATETAGPALAIANARPGALGGSAPRNRR